MKSRYIVRLDDAHPGQFKAHWDRLEKLLDELGVKPIVSIIPQNKDEALNFEVGSEDEFWAHARQWQAKGWGIAVHGLHHLLRTGYRSMVPISDYSEFSGKSFDEQLSMVTTALHILNNNGCFAKYFVAPAHGFDEQTISALMRLDPPLIVSDGFGFRPCIQNHIKFIPQQLWRGMWLPFGVWTICLHPSTMSEADFIRFAQFARRNRQKFLTSPQLLEFREKTALDKLFCLIHAAIFFIKRRFLIRFPLAE